MSFESEIESKIEDLESRIAFQENTISELSDQLALQSQDIEVHKKHIKLLNDKLNQVLFELENQVKGVNASPIERPPHY